MVLDGPASPDGSFHGIAGISGPSVPDGLYGAIEATYVLLLRRA